MNMNVHPIFDRLVSRQEQERLLNQKGIVLWFTGLSGSGKSTIAEGLERKLFNLGHYVKVLDGDNIRSGINKNLGFSLEDRKENIRRIAEVAKLFLDSGVIVLCSFVSPTIEIREMAKGIIGQDDFKEIYVDTPLAICESRDVKGLYKKARAGEIKGFTGIDSPFEVPGNPTLTLKTENKSVAECVSEAMQLI
ncbi:MAG: adenylylsulfate kinase [Saprospiraceae bacterium]|jgi:adenylylsulfate kinase|tara:strand:- start:1449 stop:2027 length:579 start_codon:yes stop_codon:yes gene_type:complete